MFVAFFNVTAHELCIHNQHDIRDHMCRLVMDQISHRACFPEQCAVVACEGDPIAEWCRFGRVPGLWCPVMTFRRTYPKWSLTILRWPPPCAHFLLQVTWFSLSFFPVTFFSWFLSDDRMSFLFNFYIWFHPQTTCLVFLSLFLWIMVAAFAHVRCQIGGAQFPRPFVSSAASGHSLWDWYIGRLWSINTPSFESPQTSLPLGCIAAI